MSTAEVIPHLTHPVTFWQSTNGKKVVMAVTGVMMFGFVVGHMLGNLQMFEAPEHINAYGHFLHNLGELLWIERGVMLLAIALHITATVQLALRSKAARPVGYSRQRGHQLLLRLAHHVLERPDRPGVHHLPPPAVHRRLHPSAGHLRRRRCLSKRRCPDSRSGGFRPGISSPSACSVFISVTACGACSNRSAWHIRASPPIFGALPAPSPFS